MTRHAALILVAALFCRASSARTLPADFGEAPEALRINLVTFGPGKALHQYFGHSALWVEDTRLRAGVLYSYGTTSVSDGDSTRFLLGRPTFWAARLPVDRTFMLYRALGRSITVQELQLTAPQRKQLLRRLEHDVQPATREYAYHPLEDNCATRVRDVLDEVLGGTLREALRGPARATRRELLRQSIQTHPMFEVLLMSWLNDEVDAPTTHWQAAFLPRELATLLEGVTYLGDAGERIRLVRRTTVEALATVASAPAVPGTAGTTLAWRIGGALASLAVLAALLRGRSAHPLFRVLFGLYHVLFGLVLGAWGVSVGGLMLFSRLDVMQRNENLWFANPVAFGLVPLGILIVFGSARAERWARRCACLLVVGALVALALKGLSFFDQDTREAMVVGLVANLGLGLAHACRWGRPSRRLHASGHRMLPG
ncbi:DUF4105 domain-containing protein [Myxococcus sp. Y35]|uniref:lipoprotein N-acyltransferase Lnb domain-containing protein n=1 Tax=Pseudomyxococcus flavus TaxID=3115648 RepID=UPI003CEF00A7